MPQPKPRANPAGSTDATGAPGSDQGVDLGEVSRLRLAVVRLSRRLRQQNTSDITPSQLSALSTIEREGPLSLGELAAIENVSPPTISRIVGTLEGDGYVERTPGSDDRRVALVRATTKANRELDRARAQRDAWLARQLAELDDDERRALTRAVPVLERLIADGRGTEERRRT